jgi:NAD(P)-dependent dehydrogenase (short-subunit alcohol dehydrogenase family)
LGRLEGKVAIVTGAGADAGMGRAVCLMFAKEGAKVVVTDIIDGGEKTASLVREAGGDAIFVKADISQSKEVENVVKKAVATYGKVNVLYNNAAICPVAFLADTDEDTYDKIMAINLKGAWLAIKHVIPEMIKAGGGSIINVASIAADAVQRGIGVYGASKAGIIALTKYIAVEYGDKGIRANTVKPGTVSTGLCLRVLGETPGAKENIEKETPSGRLGRPEEVAYLAVFLASDESSHITGQKMSVDGGIEAASHLF